ncbi:M20 family metallopeptidase [Burkholderia pseudomallei]|uniref:M20 family metallopeptidase n=1 Tax=Burkholderia pseudomallei TaxID=28450 RepID=UPI00035B9DE3|nr:M20 family metallopeptidase [Burkholderia pseudomallei]AGR69740.1 peptidase M20/M25/M40 family protein [Burkholderia pseudomallei MSHR305]AHK69397.1 peptidase M20/M25/M40 family protein [Burkholderia pseudomallei MSHR520]AIP83895.1 peptidase M20/M25/M40 family protein [Burkholderia pseudomallei]KGW47207.1 peptidase M20/M25/M40 family protein [Burkholderia pseudomallei MSHR303]MBM5616120.1 M20/M25/M40 family metallo-hydrolase [Burkholderia pseudomallei]
MSKQNAISAALCPLRDGRFFESLASRVALQTVSGPDASEETLLTYYSDFLERDLEKLGFKCERLANPVAGASPFLYAERIEDAGFLTVLTYGHGDVISGQEDKWEDGLNPWILTEKAGEWFGRGVADNKGQHLVNLVALAAVIEQRKGKLGFNVKALFELGEERGSPGLREFCKQQAEKLKSDVFIASDGPRVSKEVPTLFLGSRGAALIELTCLLRQGALHSGNWGGVIRNPAIVLSNAIASMVDGRGRIQVACLQPPRIPGSVQEAIDRLSVDSVSLGRQIDEDWGADGLTPAERLFGGNALEVLSLKAGNAEKPVNAIPPVASAYLQLRFVVGTASDAEDIESGLREHLDARGFDCVSVHVPRVSPATRLDPADPWVRWASNVIEFATCRKPAIVPNLAGTVPNDAFADKLGLPTIWVPHSYPGCNQHAPNEHLPRLIVEQGLGAMASLFWELGEPGMRQVHAAHNLRQSVE